MLFIYYININTYSIYVFVLGWEFTSATLSKALFGKKRNTFLYIENHAKDSMSLALDCFIWKFLPCPGCEFNGFCKYKRSWSWQKFTKGKHLIQVRKAASSPRDPRMSSLPTHTPLSPEPQCFRGKTVSHSCIRGCLAMVSFGHLPLWLRSMTRILWGGSWGQKILLLFFSHRAPWN